MSEKKTKDLTMEKSRQAAYIRMSPVTGDHTGESGAPGLGPGLIFHCHTTLNTWNPRLEIERDGH